MSITKFNIVSLLLSHFLLTMCVMHKTPDMALWAGLFGFLASCIGLAAARVVWKYAN